MKERNNLSKKFFQGALILTVSTIFIKLLSAMYKIPYQNIVGDVGLYIYQQVYPFYSFVLVLSTYGFPVIISKLLAEEKEKKQGYTRFEIFFASWFTLSVFSLIAFMCLYFGADFLANMMNDYMLANSIRFISFSFLLIPISSILKGIFQSEGNMIPTSISQVSEQMIRVGFILFCAYLFSWNGLSLYEVAEGAFLGSVIGSLVGCVTLAIFYLKSINKSIVTFHAISLQSLWKRVVPLSHQVLGQGIIFSISSLILVFIQFIDALILYPMLTFSGVEMTDAKILKGIYDRGQPLLQVGTAVTISLSMSIVPLIAKFKQQGNHSKIQYYTELSFRLNLMIGLAATAGLFWIIEPTNYLLFTDTKGSLEISILNLSILFCSLLMIGMFILQSLGHSIISVTIVFIGLLIKFLFMLFLVPSMHIMGAAISTTSSFIAMALLLLLFLGKIFKKMMIEWKTLKIALLATMIMSVLLLVERALFDWINGIYSPGRIVVGLQVMFSVLTGAFVYLWAVIRWRLFTKDELLLLPGGSKLMKLLPKK